MAKQMLHVSLDDLHSLLHEQKELCGEAIIQASKSDNVVLDGSFIRNKAKGAPMPEEMKVLIKYLTLER